MLLMVRMLVSLALLLMPCPPSRALPRTQVDQQAVVVDHRGGKVLCPEPGLRGRIERSLDRLAAAIRPVPVERQHQ